jgi:hypothetical protein
MRKGQGVGGVVLADDGGQINFNVGYSALANSSNEGGLRWVIRHVRPPRPSSIFDRNSAIFSISSSVAIYTKGRFCCFGETRL